MTDSQWGQLVILATTVGGFFVAEWRATRNRRWAEQDRAANAAAAIAERRAATAEIIERAAAEAEATRIKTEIIADSLRTHTALTAARLREEARIGADELIRQAAVIAAELQATTAETTAAAQRTGEKLEALVTEAVVSAKDAYKEANHVNVKIENLNQRLVAEGVAREQATAAGGTAAAETIEKIDATTERIEERQIETAKEGVPPTPARGPR